MVDQSQNISYYFPEIEQAQIERINQLYELYRFWNVQINVISRKDIENLFIHHILHSLSFLKFASFEENTTIIDIGTGGGFPGIPLAIVNPNCKFILVDGRNKKVHVVEEISKELDLTNVEAIQAQAQDLGLKVDYALGRAVSDFKSFSKIASKTLNSDGLIYYWTGGEVEDYQRFSGAKVFSLSESFTDPYFKNKFIICKGKN